jgi:hypothetical protein
MAEKADDLWKGYWDSNGVFQFTPDEMEAQRKRQEAVVHRGQNRLLEKVAEILDLNFPPSDFSSKPSPGDIVRQFIIKPTEEAHSAVSDLE